MALTRKMLKAMGIEDEKIDQIIEAHSETVDALKTERDDYKDKSSNLEDVQKELDEAKKTIESDKKDSYKEKYENEKKEFDKYKNDISESKAKEDKINTFKTLLKNVGIAEKRIDSVVKVSDLSSLKFADGKIENEEEIIKKVEDEWSDFITVENSTGAKVSNPPENEKDKKDPFLEGFDG